MNEFITRIITGVILGSIFFGTYAASAHLFMSLLLVILAVMLIFEWPKLCQHKQCLLISIFYPTLPIMLLIYLTYNYYAINKLIPLYPFIIAWLYDTSAYSFGMLFGKHKICPVISPGKSWEGLLGGFLCVFSCNTVIAHYTNALAIYFVSQNILFLLAQSGAITLAAFAGDLFISFLKRKNNLKDVGALLPGHGGLLDRFDSVLFVAVLLLFLALIH